MKTTVAMISGEIVVVLLIAILLASAALLDRSRRNRARVQPPVLGGELPGGGRTRRIEETKCTCTGCGKVWFYGKRDQLDVADAASFNCAKLVGCTCCNPLIFFFPDKKAVDLDKCPSCGSRAVRKETVTHEV